MRVEFNGYKLGGMLNIGTRPTVNESREKSIEVHIFDFNKNLYNKNAQLSVINMQLQDALLENIRLKKLLEFKETTPFKLIPAKVIGQNPHNILNTFILTLFVFISILKIIFCSGIIILENLTLSILKILIVLFR